MNTSFLKSLSTDRKKDFLKKLQSGEYNLNEPYALPPSATFKLQPDGKYLCKEDGRLLTSAEILSLPGYRMNLQLVGSRMQVEGKKPPSGFVLVPYSEDEYLDSLLRSKKELLLSYDEADQQKPFKVGNERYSFEGLRKLVEDDPEITLRFENDLTAKAYVEHLEKWI